MDIKKIFALYFAVSISSIMFLYMVGSLPLDQTIARLMLLTIPTEIDILTFSPNILGVVAVLLYMRYVGD